MAKNVNTFLIVTVAFCMSHVKCSLIVTDLSVGANGLPYQDSAVSHVQSIPLESSRVKDKTIFHSLARWIGEKDNNHERFRGRRSFDLVDERENCTDIANPPLDYNDSCTFIKTECADKHELVNYLEIAVCHLGLKLKALSFIVLGIWLIFLISLLSTTVDMFFVPVLTLLSEKLHLSPSIAGMTLLAFGNGAPDIFVAFSALKDDDLALVLGALMGAGMFITAVVLATVILVTNSRTYNIDKIDFMRDVLAYIAVLIVIIIVAYDGTVYLIEAVLFPIVYIIYVAVVLTISFFRKWLKRRRERKEEPPAEVAYHKSQEQVTVLVPAKVGKEALEHSEKKPLLSEEVSRSIADEAAMNATSGRSKKQIVLTGLTWPRGAGVITKVQYVIEWPFTLLRWLTIPPCCHDGHWSWFHYFFAVFFPIPMMFMFLLVVKDGWTGFKETVGNSPFPLPVLLVIIAIPLCVFLLLTLRPTRRPGPVMQIILMIGAFVMSIAWLNIIANEVVSVLQALGLLATVSTALLGLTVLAIGNSVADWVADTMVAKSGKPEMAFASCFGAPLITHVMGLSFALLARMIANSGHVYKFDFDAPEFTNVKLSWIFLGISLLGSAIIFPVFKFKPPKTYAVALIYIYLIFMVFSVLIEVDVMKVKL